MHIRKPWLDRARPQYLPVSVVAGVDYDTNQHVRESRLGADSMGDLWAHPTGTAVSTGLLKGWRWQQIEIGMTTELTQHSQELELGTGQVCPGCSTHRSIQELDVGLARPQYPPAHTKAETEGWRVGA